MIHLRPQSFRYAVKPRSELLVLVLEAVHPANLGPLPPSASVLASKGAQLGLGSVREFFHKVFY